MAAIWIILITVVTYVTTIALVVIGQEISVLLSIAIFLLIGFGAYKLFQSRLTRL